ncbi:ABC transporter substrate-binding protein [Sphaerisporangium krabiense]|uniref:Iron complex transport system substrate-binding protein n=1 Tax=Sphaerisporangium krabiense TaxID=763782 RepID=A0A7W8Z9B0_9ACTN|nr:iron-siderophore ABC transporter substrate-binding protein [Sphaerisporangium krabiense]MBB5629879.1 iron complex transport system substrate-binding protein [Sphaerisporangium krabiense]GII63980.1 ABC transporter substrate-binding protein [Sphaerisporangium krabiense]
MFRILRGARTAAALASVLFLGTVAACGSGEGPAGPSGSAAPATSGQAGAAYPMSIEHKYGSTTIPAQPKRVVTVGLTDQDAALAVGTVPVGTTEWLGGYPGAVGPWAKDKLGTAAAPTVLKDTGTGPQVEKIAALAPDLILALYSGVTKEQYETLSKIAPVVAQPKDHPDYGVPWERQTEIIGKALGKETEAKALVRDVEARFAQARSQHPDFAGATGVVATPYEGIFVYGPQDNRARILSSLGFTPPEGLDKAVGTEFGANISKERTDLLDAETVMWIVADPAADAAKLHQDKLYADLDVVAKGREVFVKETGDFGNAFSFVSVLSLPYTLDRLVPQLAAAVDGDPATEVPQPQP